MYLLSCILLSEHSTIFFPCLIFFVSFLPPSLTLHPLSTLPHIPQPPARPATVLAWAAKVSPYRRPLHMVKISPGNQ